MADDLKLTYDIDLRSFERGLTAIEKRALPAAQVGYLNSLAFGSRKHLQKAFETEIAGGPTPFTKRAVVVDKAVVASSGKPEAVVRVQPEQARYLQYPILGGVRRAGDPGASRYDVLTDGAERNAFGNIRKGYVKKVARKAKAEKERRPVLRQKRDELRRKGKPRQVRLGNAYPCAWRLLRGDQEREGVLAASIRNGRQADPSGAVLRQREVQVDHRLGLGNRKGRLR